MKPAETKARELTTVMISTMADPAADELSVPTTLDNRAWRRRLGLYAEDVMPVYEFTCRDCQKTFELVQSVADHEAALVRCPHCNGTNVDRLVSHVHAVTSKKS
jgi:putative FmdB family regulatory protein